jgi:hypothetical protein
LKHDRVDIKELLKNPKLDPSLGSFAVLKVIYRMSTINVDQSKYYEIWALLMEDKRIKKYFEKLEVKTFQGLLSSYSDKEFRYAINPDDRHYYL